jgi:hypothetical protein
VDEGGTIASELMNSLPCVLMVLSHAEEWDDCCAHARTVKSRDAETTEDVEGNTTLRTYPLSVPAYHTSASKHNKVCIHRPRGRAGWPIA